MRKFIPCLILITLLFISFACVSCNPNITDTEQEKYTVVYNNPDTTRGTVSTATSGEVPSGANITLPSAEAKTGYSFAGWYTASEGGTKVGDSGSAYTVTGNITLYAHWTANTYSIAFNTNGGTGTMDSISAVYGSEVSLPANTFEKESMTFAGWSTTADGEVKYSDKETVSSLSSVSGDIVTLYAVWTANGYTVKFDPNGGEGSMSPMVIELGTSKELSANTFTRTGYTFTGWNTASDASGTDYQDKDTVTDLASEAGVTITLYAVWKENTYSITLYRNINGYTDSKTENLKYTDTLISFASLSWDTEGHTFSGWNTESDGTGTSYTNEIPVSSLVAGNPESLTLALYAVWDVQSYTISFETNGHGTAIESVNATYGSSIDLSSNTYTLTEEGYTFNGWYTDTELNTPTGTSYTVKGNATLYASWTIKTFTVSFDTDGGSVVSTQTINYGQQATKPSDPELTGYDFCYWTLNSEEYDFASIIMENIILKAVWISATSYTIQFDKNDDSATGTMADQQVEYGQSVQLESLGFEKEGYIFAGWATAPDSYAMYADEDEVENLTTARGKITLYALWCPDGLFKVTDEGVLEMNNSTKLEKRIDIPIIIEGIRVTCMESHLFAYGRRDNIESVSIPSSINEIGACSFEFCSHLKNITIPPSVTSIGACAFQYCYDLTNIIIPESVTFIGGGAFYRCYCLTEVAIPSSINQIEDQTFYSCASLISITIPSSVKSIGRNAFYDCKSLISITIPSYVINIDGSAFAGCINLIDISVSSENSSYSSNEGVLYNKDKTTLICYPTAGKSNSEFTIPPSVCSIGDYAFYGCTGLTSVTIPKSVTSIGSRAFYGCEGLTSITIPSSVTGIGSGAFRGCNELTSITFDNPSSITQIEGQTFYGCESLTSITIPKSVTSIGVDAFYCCTGLTRITIPFSVTDISSGVFRGCTCEVIFEDGIKAIPGAALMYASKITSVSIPSSVTSIGRYAFSGCTELPSITIPKSVISIENYAFDGCKCEVIFEDGITTIPKHALSGADITKVSIPSSVAGIGDNAFIGCVGLNEIRFAGTSAEWSIIEKGLGWHIYVPSTTQVYCIADDTYVDLD